MMEARLLRTMELDIEDYMRVFSDHRLVSSPARNDEEPNMVLEQPLDTRRFGTIFHADIPDGVSADCGDSGDDDDDDSVEDISQWEFHVTLADTDNTTVTTSTCGSAEGSFISAAQEIAARYRAAQSSSPRLPHEDDIDSRDKALPRIPEDQRSMYTLATAGDAQSTMDLLWRPKPKIHMRKCDQDELAEAQCQAMEMMEAAGLAPTDQIQCRRRGCADILRNVDALKYHLHIHNIGDAVDATGNGAYTPFATPSTNSQVEEPPRKRSLGLSIPVPCRANLQSKTGPSHTRSKSALDAQKNSGSKRSQPSIPRKSSSGHPRALDLNVFSPLPKEDTISMHAPSLTAVAAAVAAIPARTKSPSPSVNPVPSRPNTPLRGRRTRKDTLPSRGRAALSPGREVGYNASIAMVLSPPTSLRGRTVLASQTNLPINPNIEGRMGMDKELASDNPVISIERTAGRTEWRALSPDRFKARAMSPARAISPIRHGLRRVLSIGCMNDFMDH